MVGLLHTSVRSASRAEAPCRINKSARPAPKLFSRQRGALRQRLELGPSDHRMNAAAKPAIGRGDHALAADALGEAQDALRDEFRMLDHVRRMADDARQNHLAVGKLDVLP